MCDGFFSPSQYMCDGAGAERPLQVPPDPQDGALGAAGVHPHLAPVADHEKAPVPKQQTRVSTALFFCSGQSKS